MKKKPDPKMIDKENPEWTDAVFARPASEVFPDLAHIRRNANAASAARRENRARF